MRAKHNASPEEEERTGKSRQPSSSSSLFFVRVDLEENINTSDDDEDEEDKFPFTTGNKVKRLEGSFGYSERRNGKKTTKECKTLALVIRRRLNRNWSSCRSFRPRSRWPISSSLPQ